MLLAEYKDWFDSAMIVAILLTINLVARHRDWFARQSRYITHNRSTTQTQTSNELRMQIFIITLGAMLMGVQGERYEWEVGVILLGCILLKYLLYFIVDRLYFSAEQHRLWMATYSFLITCQALAVMVAIYVAVYLDVKTQYVAFYLIFIAILFEILVINKQYRIFFSKKDHLFAYFLYLCTLEIVPLLLTWLTLTLVSKNLIVIL